MPNAFYKGRTNNHLTWVMVDATDFATPESAVSAATKIKIYGKLRGATGTNFVSSGTGSLTNDITHVGASALGTYTIALAKADLSDASAAWYDQYVISLSATGCAYQLLVVDGGIDNSTLLSQVLVIKSTASDAASAAVQANSRVLLTQSLASDAASAAAQANSRVLVVKSDTSDLVSAMTILQSRALLTQSRVSDVYSAVLLVQSDASDTLSAMTILQSRALLTQSRVSDVYSLLVAGVPLDASTMSDLRSAIAAVTATLSASDMSDLRSAITAGTSDVKSAIAAGVPLDASTMSDIRSAVNAVTVNLTASDISDIASAVVAALPITSMVSDIYSMVVGMSGVLSDTYSAVLLTQSMASDAASAAQQASSRAQIAYTYAGSAEIYASRAARDALAARSDTSDILSAVNAGVTIGASDMSDLRSAIAANGVLRVGADPTAVVGVTGTLAAKVDWITALARNKVTQTSVLQALYDDGGTQIASAAVSDDGTTFAKQKWAG